MSFILLIYLSIRGHGGEGGSSPSVKIPLSHSIFQQGSNLKKFSPCPKFPLSKKKFSPCPIPRIKIIFPPYAIPPSKKFDLSLPYSLSPEIIWPIPHSHHPPLPYPHPLSQK